MYYVLRTSNTSTATIQEVLLLLLALSRFLAGGGGEPGC